MRSYPEPLRGTCKTTLDSAIKYFDRNTRSFKLLPIKLVSRMSANEASATMTCWENKELRMGVCYKVGNPAAGPMPQTREHILLAKQVGVPAL